MSFCIYVVWRLLISCDFLHKCHIGIHHNYCSAIEQGIFKYNIYQARTAENTNSPVLIILRLSESRYLNCRFTNWKRLKPFFSWKVHIVWDTRFLWQSYKLGSYPRIVKVLLKLNIHKYNYTLFSLHSDSVLLLLFLIWFKNCQTAL